jgi:photosystem II stability/assembly factor-like uncharacterized protein
MNLIALSSNHKYGVLTYQGQVQIFQDCRWGKKRPVSSIKDLQTVACTEKGIFWAGDGSALYSSQDASCWMERKPLGTKVACKKIISKKEMMLIIQKMSPALYLSINWGQTWRIIRPTSNKNIFVKLCDCSSKVIAVILDNYCLYISTDTGKTWFLATIPKEKWQALSIHDNVLCVGINGKVYVSKDIGKTWNVSELPSQRWEGCTCFGNLIVIYSNDNTYLSADVGEHWDLLEDVRHIKQAFLYMNYMRLDDLDEKIYISFDKGKTFKIKRIEHV